MSSFVCEADFLLIMVGTISPPMPCRVFVECFLNKLPESWKKKKSEDGAARVLRGLHPCFAMSVDIHLACYGWHR